MMSRWKLGTLAVLAVLSMGLAATPQARQLRHAVGHPPGSLPVKAAEAMSAVVAKESGGALTTKVFALSLLNMAETSAGLRDGIADVGFVLTPYHASEYPHSNLISEASMMMRLMGDKVRGREGLIYIPAMAEFIFRKCAECLQEFAKQNQVFGGIVGGSSYGLLCNKPVKSLADMKGRRFRAGAANWSRWVVEMGGTPVTMTGNEMLESLKQGVVDCVVVSTPEVPNFGLAEAITDVAMAAPGGLFTTAGQNINLRVWRSLQPAQRTALMRGASVAAAQVPWSYHQVENQVLDGLRKRGARIHDTAPDLIAASQRFIEKDMHTMVGYFAEKHGVKRGQEMLTDFRALLDKWEGLTANVKSVDALSELYWQEIYSKVDTTTFGL